MNGIDFSNGSIRAGLVFVLVGAFLWGIFAIFTSVTGLNFYGETVLIFIGAGWAAYWVWKKTEFGRY